MARLQVQFLTLLFYSAFSYVFVIFTFFWGRADCFHWDKTNSYKLGFYSEIQEGKTSCTWGFFSKYLSAIIVALISLADSLPLETVMSGLN